eukprot:CAMPEP_0197078042 /NCGR_PEP_ID=MMETSP1384-20130603/212922_1 /TAXON_ID=29189 /ORGANISM="Ammonia sp." /LENGTH=836 /DNA_ID=CAMNT_0042516907 /DNA_START=342 /DNA_END=2852 /DNA_ORIENTATION=+
MDADDAECALFNRQSYEVERTKDETQLNEIRAQIQNLFVPIIHLLQQKEAMILQRYQDIQDEVLAKYHKMNQKLDKSDDELMEHREYLKSHLNFYKHKVKDSRYNNQYDSIFSVRNALHRIGKNLKKNDSKIRKLINEKQRILDNIYLSINHEVKQYIIANVDNLIVFDTKSKLKLRGKATSTPQSQSSAARKTPSHPTLSAHQPQSRRPPALQTVNAPTKQHNEHDSNSSSNHGKRSRKLSRRNSHNNNKHSHNHSGYYSPHPPQSQHVQQPAHSSHDDEHERDEEEESVYSSQLPRVHHKQSTSMDSSIHLLQQELKLDLQNNKHLDLINMSPNKIKQLKWIYDHNDYDEEEEEEEEDVEAESERERRKKYNIIDVQLMKSITHKDLQKINVLYHYHCNEEDEKENLVVNETIDDDENGEKEEQTVKEHSRSKPTRDRSDEMQEHEHVQAEEEEEEDDDEDMNMSDLPPNTPFYKNDETETEENAASTESDSKLSNWQKCTNLSVIQEGTNHVLIKIPQPRMPINVDCVWIKVVDVGYVNRHLSSNNSLVKPIASSSRSALTMTSVSPRADSCIAPITKLLVESGQTVKLQSSVEYNFDEIIVQKNGVLTVNCTAKGYLLLKVRDKLEIHSHGKLNVSGLGHKGGKRYACGDGKGGGGGCSKGYSSCGGGGGYGTFGENGRGFSENTYRENIDGIGGNIYGDAALSTIHFGSGGGGGYGSRGGAGGGIICISCKNQIILHENSGIYANGSKGKYVFDGCGSGGSIFIKCKYFLNQNNSICFVQAIGGKHFVEAPDAGHGGNGGFGRIRIYCQNIKNLQQLKEHNLVVQPPPYLG